MSIIEQITDWMENPSALEETGLIAPTQDSLIVAGMILQIINPTRVVPSGDGGVVFKWPRHTHTLEVKDDGSLDLIMWRGTQIGARMHWKVDGE